MIVIFYKILEWLKDFKLISDVFTFLRKNRILFIGFFIIFILVAGIVASINSDLGYKRDVKHKNSYIKILEILKRCNNGVAISVASVPKDRIVRSQGNYYAGEFLIVQACDYNFNKKDCILDLMVLKKETYFQKKFEIDEISYAMLQNLGRSKSNRSFFLRDDFNQSIQELYNYRSLVEILQLTDWYSLGILQELKVTAIDDIMNNVVYVITFLTNSNYQPNISCQGDNILNQIRDTL